MVRAAVAAVPAAKLGGKGTYRWKPGSRLKGGQAAAQAAGALIARLQRLHGRATPDLVLGAATPANSVIHDHFTWNNTEAARRCRLTEAAKLLRSVVEVSTVKGQQVETRAFVTDQVLGTDDAAGYTTITDALADPAIRAGVLDRAAAELATFVAKYARFRSLAAVIAVMKAWISRRSRKRGK